MAEPFTDLFWTSNDGLRLHARDYAPAGPGDRLPVFCLHGLTRNARDFEALAPRIAATGRRVLAIDVRGRGLSARDPQSDYRIPAYVRDVVALAAAIGSDRAILLGTSMGGLITMELATQAPSLVVAAIINDIGPEIDPTGLVRIAGYVGNAGDFASWDEAASYLRRQNEQALPYYAAADWLAMAHRMCRPEGDRIVSDYDPNIALPFADAPLPIDPWERWRTLVATRPTLLLRGEISDLLSADAARRMVSAGPDVRLQTVAGVGHAPMLDEPDAAAAIGTFLAEVP